MISDPLPTAREEAVRRLLRIEATGAYVNLSADARAGGAAREERQSTDYVAGVTRWKGRLDFLIDHYYRGAAPLEPVVRQILRVALYDVLERGAPAHAAVSEAVSLTRTLGRGRAAGLVNGLLRRFLREQGEGRTPQPAGDEAARLAVAWSHPEWMVRRWLARFGPEAARALLAWNNARPHYSLRVNLLRTTAADFRARLDALGAAWEPSPWLDDFVRVQHLQAVLRAGLPAEGLCAVQDESAGLVVRLLDPQPGETVVDACAAPGGKAVYAAQQMQNRGRLAAIDVNPSRLRLVRQTAAAHGVRIIETAAADFAAEGPAAAPPADRVLLDAPCSGLGVLRKRPDLRWKRTPESLEELGRLQAALLDAAAEVVRPGGLLVYATCTTEPEENERQAAAFLARRPDFALEPPGAAAPPALVTAGGALATLPHRDGVDGAFAVRLRRAG